MENLPADSTSVTLVAFLTHKSLVYVQGKVYKETICTKVDANLRRKQQKQHQR